MRIRRFNEEVGFDDEEMRDRLEIPNLKGELEPNNPDMKTLYYTSDKVNTNTEVKKLYFRYPILEIFHINSRLVEGSRLLSFYATSKHLVEENEFYTQMSFAYHHGQYYIGTILRDRLEENENKWVRHTFFFKNIDDVYKVVDSFIEACKRLGILDSSDLTPYNKLFN
jgi:hypothetical protein